MKRVDDFLRRKASQTSHRCGWPEPLTSKLSGPPFARNFAPQEAWNLLTSIDPCDWTRAALAFKSCEVAGRATDRSHRAAFGSGFFARA
jgi:hypothetical protein